MATTPTTTTGANPPGTGPTSAAPAAPQVLVYYPGAPADLSPLAPNPYFGEGHWVPAGRFVSGGPAVWVTTLRPPSGGNPVGIAQMDTSRLSIVPYAGTSQPGGSWSNQGEIPPDRQSTLVAAFNGGFQFNSAEGGFYADGRAQPALRDGAASLVEFLDGSAIVGQWGRDVSMGPYVVSVRQNLRLLVDGSVVVPSAADWGQWGATLSHGSSTWRSGVGSDAGSHLYFVGGPGLTPADLGTVLVTAGATRAMEFDINPQWVIFASFTDGQGSPPSTFGATLLPSMYYGPDHFFSPDWRDFVGVFAKEKATRPPAKAVPN
ncbi:MAG: phosphodiester glycosidase family protein [Acidimicrobiales bacterium]